MRLSILCLLGLAAGTVSCPALAAETGLPTEHFVASWTALPTGHFTPWTTTHPTRLVRAHAVALNEARFAPMLDDAIAYAADSRARRGIALDEMMTAWDQPKRSAFQRLRDTEAAYAGADDARQARFVATLTDVVDGTGRSSATDGSAPAALDEAYSGALSRAGDARAATEAEQKAWSAYRDAFAAFAGLGDPGSAATVAAKLDRQRIAELGAK